MLGDGRNEHATFATTTELHNHTVVNDTGVFALVGGALRAVGCCCRCFCCLAPSMFANAIGFAVGAAIDPPLLKLIVIQRAKIVCRDPGSDRGPSDLQSDALPTELSRPVGSASQARLWVCGVLVAVNLRPCSGETVGRMGWDAGAGEVE